MKYSKSNSKKEHQIVITKSCKLKKNSYYERLTDKLNDPTTSTNSYLSEIKTPINGKKFQLCPKYFSVTSS